MTDTNGGREIELSRRNVLGAMGALGAAGALGGAGTAAFFSDEEQFTNNELVAGSLDLKLDWEEHYNGEVVEAFPDSNDTVSQDTITNPCDVLADVPADLDSDMRTESSRGDPLVYLDDVKPGDWGEVTFSLHLCDNPGYVWLTGRIREALENGKTEPEAADEDEKDGVVELLDAIKVELWYDSDCDNEKDGGETLILGKGVGPYTEHVSLREAFEVLDRNGGRVPLDGDTSSELGWNEGPTHEDRDCFAGGTTHCIGMKWWLPVDHANEIQTDSVGYDLGFYTEQCRHNSGAGMPPEVVDTVEVTEGFGTNSGTTYSLTASSPGGAGYPENMVTTVAKRENSYVFELDLPKALDDSAGDNWSLTFDAGNDGTADFQVVYNNGFGYVKFNGSWGGAPLPAGIQTRIEDAADGRYEVEIPVAMLTSSFAFGGQLRYNGEEPGNPGQNFVVNVTPGFSWGPGFNGDASAYYDVTL